MTRRVMTAIGTIGLLGVSAASARSWPKTRRRSSCPCSRARCRSVPAAPLVFFAYGFVWVALAVYIVVLWRRIANVERELGDLNRAPAVPPNGRDGMPSSHFLFIPGVLMVGVVIGWILGARAAKDAYAAELSGGTRGPQRKNGVPGGS